MKAIVHERYGTPDVLELRDVDMPAIEDDQVLLRVHAASVNPVEWYGVTGAVLRPRVRRRPAQAQGHDGRRRRRGAGRSRRQGRHRVPAGRRGVRHVGRLLGRVRAGPRGSPRAEAGQRVVRGSGGRPGRGDHSAPGAARQGQRPARAEGADQRRVRRRRHLRRPARQGARSGRDRRLQHGERGSGSVARRRPRRRLHQGGLHAARRASRPDARHRREPPVQAVQARADTQGDCRGHRSEIPVEQGARTSVSHHRNARGLGGPEPDGQVLRREDQHGGPRLPGRAARSRKGEIRHRPALRASEAADALRYLGEGHARGKVIITM